QIFTRRGGEGLKPEFSVSGGTWDTQQVNAALAGGDSQRWFSVQGSWQQTEGFDACRGSSVLFAGCFTEEPDRDGNEYRSASARGGFTFGAGGSLEASFLRAASDVEYDGSFANRSEIVQQVAGLTATQKLGEGITLTARLARAWDESDDFVDQDFQGDFNTTRDNAGAQLDYALGGKQVLTFGIDYLKDSVDSSTPYTVDERDDTGLYAQYTGSLGAWRVEGSYRHDDNQQFGSHETGSIALGYVVAPALQLVAQYGTAFRAPTFNELYYPGFSNPELVPERSRSAEVAIKGVARAASWRVSLFHTEITDLVGFDENFLPANVDEARIRGAEATLTLEHGAWRVESGVTALDTENRGSGSDAGNELPRRAPLAGHVDLQWRHEAFTAGMRLRAEDDRWDDAANTRRLDAFATVDVQAEYRVARDWRLQARVANLLDEQYETVAYYNQPGRAVYLTLRYSGR
ncbi:MAG TPA: TonB-dependent receptor, partial [Steroidobacteraceae bacterium]|nr:TonB-dependent receptor [Steroidobacteraceae bacterium]